MDPLTQTLIHHLRELELQPPVTYEQVKTQRNVLLRVWHPDKHAGDPALHATATAKTQCINAAFEFITKYAYLLPTLTAQAGAGPHGPFQSAANPSSGTGGPPPNTPPPSGPGGNRRTPKPPRSAPHTNAPPSTPPPPSSWPARWIQGNEWQVLFLALVGSLALVLLMVAREAQARQLEARQQAQQAQQAEALRAAEVVKPPEPPPKPPRPPTWRPVIEDSGVPVEEIAQLTGSSDMARRSAVSTAFMRSVDINRDDKDELLVTRVNGTCRAEGCPVYLFWRKYGKLRDLLPNNYGWSSVALLDHQTNGARDIIITEGDWDSATLLHNIPAERPCKRLIWQRRGERYAVAADDPPPEVCFEAQKSAWNIAAINAEAR